MSCTTKRNVSLSIFVVGSSPTILLAFGIELPFCLELVGSTVALAAVWAPETSRTAVGVCVVTLCVRVFMIVSVHVTFTLAGALRVPFVPSPDIPVVILVKEVRPFSGAGLYFVF